MARGSRFGLINFPVPTNLTDVKGLTHMQMGIWAIIVIFVFYSFYKMFKTSSFSSSSFGGPIGATAETTLAMRKLSCERDKTQTWKNGKCVLKDP